MTTWNTALFVVDKLSGTSANPPAVGGAFSCTRGYPALFLTFPRSGSSVAVASIGSGGVSIG